MIEFKNISKKFGKLQVLSNLDMNLPLGECIALLGPNGCGKTTLIKTLLGMVIPDEGAVYFDSKNIKNEVLYRKKIGFMPQIGRYPQQMSIKNIFEMVFNLRKNEERDMELYDSFVLEAIQHKKMGTLSGGTTQKISAALAFLFNPTVYVLDEPTAGLDPLAAEILKEKILKEKNKGKLILITSHVLSELDELVSRIVFMQDGKLQFHCSVQELKEKTNTHQLSKAIIQILRSK